MIPLLRALRLEGAPKIGLVGAGGKTGLMFGIARALPAETILVTTTTHLGASQFGLADHHVVAGSPEEIARLATRLPSGIVLITGPAIVERDRISGLDAHTLAALRRLADQRRLPLLIEADGSRQRPVKAPADHEPAIPGFVELVLVLAGLGAIGMPLHQDWVHRPEIFSTLSGLEAGRTITANALAGVLVHPRGGLKAIPNGARRVACLTQAGNADRRAHAAGLADRLLSRYHAVLALDFGSMETGNSPQWAAETSGSGQPQVFAVHERIAGIVLAAGGSTRFADGPKQLLDWEGIPLVRKVASTAIEAGLEPVIVVLGAHAEKIGLALDGMPVEIRVNESWAQGQASSVRAGIDACPPEVGGAVFLLVDQPQIPATLIRSLVEAHSRTLAAITVPQIDGGRGNPVLFDRTTFSGLLDLTGDEGGRALFSRYRIEWVPWHDPRMLLDIDSLEDYVRLIREMRS